MTASPLSIEHVPIGALRPDAFNPRRISDDELEALTHSIGEFGLVDPIARRLPRACATPGCPELTPRRRCPRHQRAYEAQRGTAAQRGYGAGWRQLRAAFLQAHPFCACGQPATEVDHKVPLSKGGTDAWENLDAKCKGCHSRKTVAEMARGEDGRLG